jgi:hypothetical protein
MYIYTYIGGGDDVTPPLNRPLLIKDLPLEFKVQKCFELLYYFIMS